MSSSLLIILILAILFLAALVKATLGFGESLLGIPLLTLLLGIQVATPLLSLIAAVITVMIVMKSWQQIDLQVTWRLLVAAVIGIPLGVWGLKTMPADWLTMGLGVLIIFVGLYNLLKPTLKSLEASYWVYLFGFVAGVFGGAYGTASPPVLVYGAMRRWTPDRFRVTLQGFFLPVSILILISHASAGLWTIQVLQLFAMSIPIMIFAFWAGSLLNERLPTQQFERLVYIGLVIIGITLLV